MLQAADATGVGMQSEPRHAGAVSTQALGRQRQVLIRGCHSVVSEDLIFTVTLIPPSFTIVYGDSQN